MNKLKISVVTVCYNAVETLEETMLSVLNQTYPDIEYIIIDGGSTDGTVDIIKKYADRLAYWVSEPDKGIYDAMNKGIDIATGDYINFMNAGDKFYQHNTVASLLESFTIMEPTTIIYGDTLVKHKNRISLNKALQPFHLKKRGAFCHQSAFIKLSYHKTHKFNLNYKILSDFNFFFYAYNVDKVSFFKYNDIVSMFSMIDGGLSKLNYDDNYKELIEIIQPNINRCEFYLINLRRLLGKLKRKFLIHG